MASAESALNSFAAVVITGGSSGIGKSFIELLSLIGPKLVFCNLSRRSPEIISEKLKLRHVPCDLSDRTQIDRALAEVTEILEREVPEGRILLINNSGYGLYGPFEGTSGNEQVGMVDVNVGAVIQLTAGLLPLMKRRGGVIVTVASTAAFQPTPYFSTYGATKAFVLHWSLSLNEELRGTGVSTLAVCPGPTSTDFFSRAGLVAGAVPDAIGQTSEEVVRTTLKAIAKGRTVVVSGLLNRLMAVSASRLPKALAARLSALLLKGYKTTRKAP